MRRCVFLPVVTKSVAAGVAGRAYVVFVRDLRVSLLSTVRALVSGRVHCPFSTWLIYSSAIIYSLYISVSCVGYFCHTQLVLCRDI